jgi:hypothetical protein
MFAAGLLFLAGCEKDEIRSYSVPKAPTESNATKVRLLAAIFERGKEQWFFKLLGPDDEVSKQEEAFKTFIGSVRFTGKADSPVTWTVPEGWKESGPRESKRGGIVVRIFNAFAVGDSKKTELTVNKFDGQSDLLANVNRWARNDVGLPPFQKNELAAVTKTLRVGDEKATLIDLKGPGTRPGARRPPMMAGADVRHPTTKPIKYMVPDGWNETGPRSTMGILIVTSFQIQEGDQRAEVQVTPLPGSMVGGLLGNVNRWRGQVGLADITQAQLDRDPPKSIRVGNAEAPYYDFTGPSKRMLLVRAQHAGQTWYLKMIGSTDLVGKNKSKFESFVKSVQFTGAANE